MRPRNPLTPDTLPASNLADKLEAEAILPANLWKRLFLVALRRMINARKKTLAQLCAVEAWQLAFTYYPANEALERFRAKMMQVIESRKVGRGRIKKSMDPLYLWLRYLKIRGDLESMTNPKKAPSVVERFWLLIGGTSRVPKDLVDIAQQQSPVDAALEIVGAAYHYKPDSLRQIFKRQGWKLDHPKGDMWEVRTPRTR